jgi:hypothetical protein
MATILKINASGAYTVKDAADQLYTTDDIISIGDRCGVSSPVAFPTDVRNFEYLRWTGTLPYQAAWNGEASKLIGYKCYGVPVFTTDAAWITPPTGVLTLGNDTASWYIQKNKTAFARSGNIYCTVTGTEDTYVITTTIEQPATATTYDSISLGYHASTENGACAAGTSTYYTDIGAGSDFTLSSNIWDDLYGTLNAPAGYYSDGSDVRYWNGAGGLAAENACTI